MMASLRCIQIGLLLQEEKIRVPQLLCILNDFIRLSHRRTNGPTMVFTVHQKTCKICMIIIFTALY